MFTRNEERANRHAKAKHVLAEPTSAKGSLYTGGAAMTGAAEMRERIFENALRNDLSRSHSSHRGYNDYRSRSPSYSRSTSYSSRHPSRSERGYRSSSRGHYYDESSLSHYRYHSKGRMESDDIDSVPEDNVGNMISQDTTKVKGLGKKKIKELINIDEEEDEGDKSVVSKKLF